MFKIKPISTESIPTALEKAVRYRLLNEPMLAESICLDILDADPDNSEALVNMLLAITEQFGTSSMGELSRAKELLPRLPGEYDQHYYAGLICERQGKSKLTKRMPDGGEAAYEWLREAMDHYEKAEAISPPEKVDAILRWNTCARLIMNQHLKPRNEEYIELPLE